VSGQPAGRLKDVSAKAEAKKLSREDFFRSRVRTVATEVNSLGGEVVLRSLTRAQVEEIQVKSHWGSPQFDQFLYECWTILLSVVDPALKEEDLDQIKDLDNSVFQDLTMEVQLLNMVGQVEEAKKASEETSS
jgi:hypothetical protein